MWERHQNLLAQTISVQWGAIGEIGLRKAIYGPRSTEKGGFGRRGPLGSALFGGGGNGPRIRRCPALRAPSRPDSRASVYKICVYIYIYIHNYVDISIYTYY